MKTTLAVAFAMIASVGHAQQHGPVYNYGTPAYQQAVPQYSFGPTFNPQPRFVAPPTYQWSPPPRITYGQALPIVQDVYRYGMGGAPYVIRGNVPMIVIRGAMGPIQHAQ